MKTYFYLICLVFLFFACKDETHDSINKSNGKPGEVTEVSVRRIPGGAAVSYRVPETTDLLAVKAVYTISNGTKREAVASYFTDSLILDGFADTIQHEALLYSVSRTQELSNPVPIRFTPLESPLNKTAKTVEIFPDYGGVAFTWENEDKEPLTFDLLTEDKDGNMQTVTIFQSDKDSVDYTLRGYLPEPRKFALNISDNFGNSSGLIYPSETLTPLREDRMDYTRMSIVHLNNDNSWSESGTKDYFLIDNNLNTLALCAAVPCYLTIDLGKKTILSRLAIFQRYFNDMYYSNGNPKTFQVYACNVETPSPNALSPEWTLVMNCIMIKPSGAPLNVMTSEDRRTAKAGDNFPFPRDMSPVRYIRFYFTQSWEWGNVNMTEIMFYGIDTELE